MQEIKLTQGRVAIVDDCDYEYLVQWKWYSNCGYAMRGEGGNFARMHKVILERMGVTPRKQLKIAHKFDYRRAVLVPPIDTTPGPKKIPLTHGRFAIVDSCDYEYLMQWNWSLSDTGYAIRSGRTRMHREVLKRAGHSDFPVCDHINHIKTDNRRGNLRPATKSQNRCNSKLRRDNTSGHKGVSWCKVMKKWCAYINKAGKRFRLGHFDDKLDAAKAYNKAALKLHGEFAKLNKV